AVGSHRRRLRRGGQDPMAGYAIQAGHWSAGAREDRGTVKAKPQVAILMGSDSDWETMSAAAKRLEVFGGPCDGHVLSAHRTPERTAGYAASAAERGIKVFICGAGGAAHLAGAVAAQTTLPVIGVPLDASSLKGLDALLATVQMPKGVPVATV